MRHKGNNHRRAKMNVNERKNKSGEGNSYLKERERKKTSRRVSRLVGPYDPLCRSTVGHETVGGGRAHPSS